MRANNRAATRTHTDTSEQSQLEGRKVVLEALNNNRAVDKVFIKKDAVEGAVKVIAAKARQAGIPISEVTQQKLDELSQSRNHQGVIALTPASEYSTVADILAQAASRNEEPFIIVLDGITDTYNMGAIIRTANACGAHGVIIPKHRSATLSGQVAKASAGAVLYTKVARVVNISALLRELKQNGIWIYGASHNGDSIFTVNIKGAAALVIGSEGSGISRLIAKECDFNIGIPMYGEVASLNASVAAGILMYEIVKSRKS